jgi:hypothetical protein
LYFAGDLTGSRFAPRRLIRRRSRLESKFAVNLLDVNASASAPAGGAMDHYYRAIDSLAYADGLVYFIDPLAEPDVNFMNQTINELLKRFAGTGRMARYFPHQVSVCMTKFDHPAVFQEARRNGLVGYDRDGFPTVHEEHAKEFFDLLCRGNFWSSRHGIDYRGAFIGNELRRCFYPERIRYFVTSSIGFWRPPGWGSEVHFDPQDFANCIQVPGEERSIRGAVSPVNVLEPILSLQQRLGAFSGLHGPVTSLKSSEASLPTPPRETPLRQDARTLAGIRPAIRVSAGVLHRSVGYACRRKRRTADPSSTERRIRSGRALASSDFS